MKSLRSKIGLALICSLFLFLPFSSWLVSIYGMPEISLVRDVLILVLFILSLLKKDWDRKSLIRLSIPALFLLYGAISFSWREASDLQWLRGVRFLFGPILLYLSLLNFDFAQSEKKTIYWSVLSGGLIISLIAILEFFGIRIPVTSKYSDNGAINDIHRVGTLALVRLNGILAGPNALGLYALSLIAFGIGVFKKINQKLIWLVPVFTLILVLTFSRSSLLGLMAMILIVIGYLIKKSSGWRIALASIILFISMAFCIFSILYSLPKTRELLTHNDSSSIRLKEYSRIWETKGEIGLLGRGVGTAGPSSQNRLDNGPNHYTENIYLDIFEELGYVGLFLYLGLLLFTFKEILKYAGATENYTALLLFAGFCFTGLFINNYTGQVAVFLFWLINGLVVKNRNKVNPYNFPII